MLGHAPDRLDVKSPRWGAAAVRQHTLSPLTISSSQKSLAQVQGTGRMSFSVDLPALVCLFLLFVMLLDEVLMADSEAVS